MKEKIILFDIDYTLFDAQIYRKLRDKNIAKHFNLDLSEVTKAGKEYSLSIGDRMNFSAKGLADYLGKKFGIDGSDILNFVFSEPSHFKGAIYPDVIPAFQNLISQGHTLGIFSEGDIENQQNKLKHTGLLNYLDKELIFIFERKMKPENLAQIPKEALVVDDNFEIVRELKELGYMVYQVDRSKVSRSLRLLSF